MGITINNTQFEYVPGRTFAGYAAGIPGANIKRILAFRDGGNLLSPDAVPEDGMSVSGVTCRDEDGRRIYERTLSFMFLMALHDILGDGVKARMENSLGRGIYITLTGAVVTPELAAAIEKRMRELVAADIPFKRHRGTKADAIKYFEEKGETDKTRLLAYRRFEHFLLYSAGDILEYFYGEMAPSTGYADVFAIIPEEPGLLMMMTELDDPDKCGRYVAMPKLKATFAEMAAWNRTQNLSNAADLNDRIVSGDLNETIRICEGKHEREVYRIAERFAESGARILLIAGPSSSGKTTFSHRLKTALTVLGMRPSRISLDDYYIDRDKMTRESDGSYDFERLDALNVPLLCSQLTEMIEGRTVTMPHFNFKAGRSEPGRVITVEPGQPIIIEGIHGLNEKLTETIPRKLKFKVYISALSTLNLDDHNRIRTTDMRLLRRIVRDNLFRGTSPEDTIAMWPSVRRGERNYIFPYQEEADMMFNSTLGYEPCIMKKYAYPLLKAVKPEDPAYTTATRLLKFLNYIYSAELTDEVPPGSLLREFVGGSCYADIKE